MQATNGSVGEKFNSKQMSAEHMEKNQTRAKKETYLVRIKQTFGRVTAASTLLEPPLDLKIKVNAASQVKRGAKQSFARGVCPETAETGQIPCDLASKCPVSGKAM